MTAITLILFLKHAAPQAGPHFLTKRLKKEVPDPNSYMPIRNHTLASRTSPKRLPMGVSHQVSLRLNPEVSHQVSLRILGPPNYTPSMTEWILQVIGMTGLGTKKACFPIGNQSTVACC